MTSPAPTVVLLAAGLGTRYGALKQLDPVGPDGAAILDYTLADAARAGFGRAVVVVRPEIADRVADHLERTGAGGLPATLVHQSADSPMPPGMSPPAGRAKPWGTTHAVLAAGGELRGAFAVANADDHYGAAAWTCLAEWIVGGPHAAAPSGGPGVGTEDPDASAEDAAVVGYRLDATLSEHGGVSRALCEIDPSGRLRRIREATDVLRGPEGVIRGRVGGEERPFEPDARVSMNLWGFRPPVLPVLEGAFGDFLAAGPEAGGELQLPEVLDAALTAGSLRARLLPCGEAWFGITWPEDRPEVVRRLARRGPPGRDLSTGAS
ncbi:MAG: NTP transferase domain-containing protein [Gemmatimonadota bacterium]|jgi:hypothetical protein